MNPAARLDRTLAHVTARASWLVLPVSLLLFLQWPLRDLFHAWSRQANDLGQILFALYVSFAVTAATRARSHLAIDLVARRYGEGTRLFLTRAIIVAGLLPWALFVLFTGRNIMWNSILQLERFGDTLDPGYFIVKSGVFLLALLMLLQGLLDLFVPSRVGAKA